MRHRSIAAVLAVLASLAIGSTALAGNWAQVNAQNPPVDPPAGQETTINLEVLQHGETPVSWPKLTVVATDAVSGTTIRAAATPLGPAGAYTATLVFPTAGDWALTYTSPDLHMEGRVAMHVGAAVGAAPAGAGTPSGQPGAPATDMSLLVVLLFALAVGLAVGGLGLLGRRGATDAPVSART